MNKLVLLSILMFFSISVAISAEEVDNSHVAHECCTPKEECNKCQPPKPQAPPKEEECNRCPPPKPKCPEEKCKKRPPSKPKCPPKEPKKCAPSKPKCDN